MSRRIGLDGSWAFRLDKEKQGTERHFEREDFAEEFELPGTVSLWKKGEPGKERPEGHLYDPYGMEGYIWLKRRVTIEALPAEGQRFILYLERSRITRLWVDGTYVGSRESFIGAQEYDITPFVKELSFELTIMVSNTDYKTGGGHLTSPDTQTNWIGILGEISLRVYDGLRIKRIFSDCDIQKGLAKLRYSIENDMPRALTADLRIAYRPLLLKKEYAEQDSDMSGIREMAKEAPQKSSTKAMLQALTDVQGSEETKVWEGLRIEPGLSELNIELPLEAALFWSEEHPYVYCLESRILAERDIADEKSILFGMKEFSTEGMEFRINGHRTFLRGKHDGMIFPLTGFAPMNVYGWLYAMKQSVDMGINHYRYHTCCPPEAAFLAADLLGIYMQPELPFWGTFNGKEDEGYDEKAQTFLEEEGFRMLDAFSSHPSFCMMSMGNELWGNPAAINELLAKYKAYCPKILLTQGSNNFQWVPNIQPFDDFFSGVRFTVDRQIRGSYASCDQPYGHVQRDVPGTRFQYEKAIHPDYAQAAEQLSEDGYVEIQYGTGIKRVKLTDMEEELIPSIPVISHEVGQYETYPDFDEIEKYTGVLRPENLKLFRERLEEKGLGHLAKAYFENSGALALACYKDEIETAFRTESLSGFQLLDIQDFAGQGTALVGMLNAFMENKGLVAAPEWRRFCGPLVLQAEFDSYILTNGGKFSFDISLAAFTEEELPAAQLYYCLRNKRTGELVAEDRLSMPEHVRHDGRSILGEFTCRIAQSNVPQLYELELCLVSKEGGKALAENAYTLYAYPPIGDAEEELSHIPYYSDKEEVQAAAEDGQKVLLFLKEEEEKSIKGTYAADFWCFPMFRSISEGMGKEIPVGTLGLLIGKEHPALAQFPTESHSTPQWFSIVERSRNSILDGSGIEPIIRSIDNFERNHSLGLLYEIGTPKGDGRILVCTADLPALVREGHVEALALMKSLDHYLRA